MSNNRLIFKNAAFLYFKMAITIIVSIVSTRIILDTLGVVDFGIYNVVASVVVFFLIFNNTLTSSSQRHFSIALASGDNGLMSNTFNASFRIHFVFSVTFLLITAVFGKFIVENVLNIPTERLSSALTLFYAVTFICSLNILETPFKAMIQAHEDMHVLAIQGVYDSIIKLLIAYVLTIVLKDKLCIYAYLLLLLAITNTLLFYFYSNRRYRDIRLILTLIPKEIYIELLSFAGWTTFGAFISLIRYQYVAMAMNIFIGPVANSALGVANQLGSQILKVNQNIISAYNPQIVKSFGSNQVSKTIALTSIGSKLSFFLSLLVGLPLIFEANTVLGLWLKEVPIFTLTFSRVVIMNAFLDSLIGTLIVTIQATGEIKKYQIISGLTFLLNIPVIYLLLKLNMPAYSVLVSNLVFTIIVGGIRLFYLKQLIKFPIGRWLKDVFLKNIVSAIMPIFIYILLFIIIDNSYLRLTVSVTSGVALHILMFFLITLTSDERKQVLNFIKRKYANN